MAMASNILTLDGVPLLALFFLCVFLSVFVLFLSVSRLVSWRCSFLRVSLCCFVVVDA
eukprot:m.387295 g.387295  ORF g.387295 m.387295 type:complete len:58 (-) comp56313_c0_seq3:1874-2047(-)